MPELTDWLERCPLVAILRTQRVPTRSRDRRRPPSKPDSSTIIEVPLDFTEPIISIRRLTDRFGGQALIGAGTVTEERQIAEIAGANQRPTAEAVGEPPDADDQRHNEAAPR